MNIDTINNAPLLKKYKNITPEKAIFIENITQHIKYYMNEIEHNLKFGLSLINEFKESGLDDTSECQQELVKIVKNVEECSAGIQRLLAQEGAPTYYLMHGRVAVFDNGMPIDSFLLHDDDDSSSDDSDDEDGTSKIMRKFGIKPAAQFTFTVTQNGDNISVSDLETVYNHIPALTQGQVENMVMAPIVAHITPPEPAPVALEPVKKRGRPKKVANTIDTASTAITADTATNTANTTDTAANKPVVKKRGRPKKVSNDTV